MIEIVLPKENLIEVCFTGSLKNVIILYNLNMAQYFVLTSYWIKSYIIHDLLHVLTYLQCIQYIILAIVAVCLFPGHFFPSHFLKIFVPW